MSDKRFKVALSFPGEKRDYVLQVAELLAEQLGKEAVFYDAWHEDKFPSMNFDTYLQKIYHQDSQLIIPFLCIDYERKEWCGLEWRAIRDLIKKREDKDIMLLRFDDVDMPGIFSIDRWIDLRINTPEQIAELIFKRLKDKKCFWQIVGKFKLIDGLAIDTEIDLMWLRFTHEQVWGNETANGHSREVNWENALKVAEVFNEKGGYAGYIDWRLPTMNELETLVTIHRYINSDVFPNNSGGNFWSSSLDASNYSQGYGKSYFGFLSPKDYLNNKDFCSQVRLVRSGQ
ncbi:DUF1566 domain-containing protein [Crenothrix sp.]|uniref:Lcl domain-containing protein n=1 Tax=Crenothrix sp. TaxID=3100433 RepID=UPI00374C8C9A